MLLIVFDKKSNMSAGDMVVFEVQAQVSSVVASPPVEPQLEA